MSQRSDEVNQKLITFLIVCGLCCVFFGIIGLAFFFNPSFALLAIGCIVLVVLGLGMAGFGIVYGILIHRATATGPQIREANCRIMARYGVNSVGDVMSSDWATDSEEFRPHVRLYSPTKGAVEYECAMPVWNQCGEGMLGEAVVQGRWLSQFTPYMGAPPQP